MAQQSTLLLAILLPGLFVVDLIYGALTLSDIELAVSPGQLVRGALLLVAGILLLQDRSILFGKLGAMLISLGTLMAISMIISPYFPQNVSYDINQGSRILYGPLLVVLFIKLLQAYRVNFGRLMRYVEMGFYTIGLSLLGMSLVGVGEDTYGSYAYGFKGLFTSQNEVGLAATIALSGAVYSAISEPRLIRFVALFVAILGLTALGTRTAMVAPLVVSIAVSIVLIISALLNLPAAAKLARKLSSVVIVLLISAYCSISSYERATGQQIIPVSALSGASDFGPTQYQKMKMQNTLEGEAPRKALLEWGLEYTSGRELLYDVLGEGSYAYRLGVTRHWKGSMEDNYLKHVEMDWFDLYGQYGILFAAALYLFYLFFLILAVFKYLTSYAPAYGVVAVMLGIYLGHSCIAGHALNSPMVSTQIAAVVAFLYLTLANGQKSGQEEPRRYVGELESGVSRHNATH